MYATLKTMVPKAVDSTYIFDPHNVFTQCIGSSMKDIMNHLMARYEKIIAAGIKYKENPSNDPWKRHIQLMNSSRFSMSGYNVPVRQTHRSFQKK